jgi:hypothetical protein
MAKSGEESSSGEDDVAMLIKRFGLTEDNMEDTERYLGVPLLITEYGKFIWEDQEGGENATMRREQFLGTVLDAMYALGSCGGIACRRHVLLAAAEL